jgi:hypothetical protein
MITDFSSTPRDVELDTPCAGLKFLTVVEFHDIARN